MNLNNQAIFTRHLPTVMKKDMCLSIVDSDVGWMRDVVRGLPLDVLDVAPAR